MRVKTIGGVVATLSIVLSMLLTLNVISAASEHNDVNKNTQTNVLSYNIPLPSRCSVVCEPSESILMPAFMFINNDITTNSNGEEKNSSGNNSGINIKQTDSDSESQKIPNKGNSNEITAYEFSLPVPESEKIDDKYFENALFIGDSRTVGMQNWSGVKSYYYCKVGLNIRGVLTNAFIEDNLVSGEPVTRTIIDTIEKYPVFKKVYISFGLNELGWDEKVFINTYSYVVDRIAALLPNSDIYIQAILPISEKTSDKNKNNINNKAINNYNTLLAELADEKKVYFLSINEPFTDEKGCLTEESGDGIHLGAESVRKQFDYLRTHTVDHKKYLTETESETK